MPYDAACLRCYATIHAIAMPPARGARRGACLRCTPRSTLYTRRHGVRVFSRDNMSRAALDVMMLVDYVICAPFA